MQDESLGGPVHRGLVFYGLPVNTPRAILEELFDHYNGLGYWSGSVRDETMPCFWWDTITKLCKHYEFRPDICAFHEPTPECCGNSERRCTRCGECCATMGSPPILVQEEPIENGG